MRERYRVPYVPPQPTWQEVCEEESTTNRKALRKAAERHFRKPTRWIGGRLYFSASLEAVPGAPARPKLGKEARGLSAIQPSMRGMSATAQQPRTSSTPRATEPQDMSTFTVERRTRRDAGGRFRLSSDW